MTKIWTRSLTGLQIYEGKKHIATVHYAGNPIVDVSEAMENAKLIEEAPTLHAQRDKLVKALEHMTDEFQYSDHNLHYPNCNCESHKNYSSARNLLATIKPTMKG